MDFIQFRHSICRNTALKLSWNRVKCIVLYGFKQKVNRETRDETAHIGVLGAQWFINSILSDHLK